MYPRKYRLNFAEGKSILFISLSPSNQPSSGYNLVQWKSPLMKLLLLLTCAGSIRWTEILRHAQNSGVEVQACLGVSDSVHLQASDHTHQSLIVDKASRTPANQFSVKAPSGTYSPFAGRSSLWYPHEGYRNSPGFGLQTLRTLAPVLQQLPTCLSPFLIIFVNPEFNTWRNISRGNMTNKAHQPHPKAERKNVAPFWDIRGTTYPSA